MHKEDTIADPKPSHKLNEDENLSNKEQLLR